MVVVFKPLLYYVLSGTPAWLALADAFAYLAALRR